MKTRVNRILEMHDKWLRDGGSNQKALRAMSWMELLDFRQYWRKPASRYLTYDYGNVEITSTEEINRRLNDEYMLDDIPKELKLILLIEKG